MPNRTDNQDLFFRWGWGREEEINHESVWILTGYGEARGNWIAHVYSLNGGANKTAIYCTAACSEGPVHTTPLSAKQLPKNTAILPTHALPLISPVSSPFREAKSLHCIPHGNGLSSMVRRNWKAKDLTSIERDESSSMYRIDLLYLLSVCTLIMKYTIPAQNASTISTLNSVSLQPVDFSVLFSVLNNLEARFEILATSNTVPFLTARQENMLLLGQFEKWRLWPLYSGSLPFLGHPQFWKPAPCPLSGLDRISDRRGHCIQASPCLPKVSAIFTVSPTEG